MRPLIERGESENEIEVESFMLALALTVSPEGVAWQPAGENDAGIINLLVSRETQ